MRAAITINLCNVRMWLATAGLVSPLTFVEAPATVQLDDRTDLLCRAANVGSYPQFMSEATIHRAKGFVLGALKHCTEIAITILTRSDNGGTVCTDAVVVGTVKSIAFTSVGGTRHLNER